MEALDIEALRGIDDAGHPRLAGPRLKTEHYQAAFQQKKR
jgi:hypothetical protein